MDSLEEVISEAIRVASEFYRITKHKSDAFEIAMPEGKIKLRARGKLKRYDGLMVGDMVAVDRTGEEYVIAKVMPRKNSLIRPAVANVDLIVIVIAPKPEPDLALVDKLIINCHRAGIPSAICINKADLGGLSKADMLAQYGADVDAVVEISAVSGDLSELTPLLENKLVCFAGQSAVGKSTISNAYLGGQHQAVGTLSEKIDRGKNTTTAASILTSPAGFEFIDTPGFSMLDVFEEDPDAVAAYYNEFVDRADACKFHPCTHTSEPDCAVKRAVENGEINRARYERYLKIFEECKEAKRSPRRYK